MPRAVVELTTSWTRSSPDDAGAMGIGVAFLEPKAGGQRLAPPPDTRTHTAAALSGLGQIFGSAPPSADVEVELPHRLLVSSFARQEATPRGALETAKFLKGEALHRILASPEVVHAFLLALSKRTGETRLKMLPDRGRFMSLATTQLQPAGVIAAKRMEAVARGAFMLFRAVGGNDDLLEVRWAAVIEGDAIVFQDRLRDFAMAELVGLRAWAGKLSPDDVAAEFGPKVLAEEDPGIFWSCVRHGGPLLADWHEDLRSGRDLAFKRREEALLAAGLECDPEFSTGPSGYDVAVAADEVCRAALEEMVGDREGPPMVELFEKGDAAMVAAAEDRALARTVAARSAEA